MWKQTSSCSEFLSGYYVVLENMPSESNEEQSTFLFDEASAKRFFFMQLTFDSINNELTRRFKHYAWFYKAVYDMSRKSKFSSIAKHCYLLKSLVLQFLAVTPPGEQEGKVVPPLLFWAVFPVRANPLRKIFEGSSPRPLKLLSVCCSTNETNLENVLFDL